MKKLFLIRHAKSSWDNPALADFDRPLNTRGEKNASMMAKRLIQKGISPDLIYSSSANRAKTTALLITKELQCVNKLVFKDELYDTEPLHIIAIINQTPHDVNTLFVVGHNPELGELASYLVGLEENIPTSGIVEIAINANDWSNFSKQECSLVSFDYPKKLS